MSARCLFDGALVGMRFELPSEPARHYTDEGELLGCNHLVCPDCGADVRHFDAVRLAREPDGPAGEITTLYDGGDATLLTAERAGVDFRVYVCRCNYEQTSAVRKLSQGDVALNWACAGHPAAE